MQSNRLILGLIVVLHCFLIVPLLKAGLAWPSYFLLILLVCSSVQFGFLIFSKSLNDPLSAHPPLQKQDYFFVAILLLATITISKLYIQKYTIWLDEADAGVSSLVDDIFIAAANYQQPPLDYLYRRWGLLAFGKNEVGLRLASVVAYIIFIVVSYFNFLRISKNSALAFGFALLLSLNDWIVRYAVEARPYALGLCYFALFSSIVIDILQSHKYKNLTESEPLYKKDYRVTFITFFWLMTIGMQPFLFVCSSVMVGLIYASISKNLKIKKIAMQMGAGFALFIPFQLIIIKFSTRYFKSQGSGFDGLFIQNLNQSLEVLLNLFTLNWALTVVFVVALMVILLGASSTAKKHIVLLFSAILISYTTLLMVFFAFKINWLMAYRYLLLNLALFYYLLFLAAHYYKENAHQLKKLLILFFCILVSAGSLYKYNLNDLNNVNWRGLYQAMQQKTAVKADAYLYAFYGPDHTGIDGSFIASEYYDTSKISLHATRGSAYMISLEYIESLKKNSDAEAFIAVDKMTMSAEEFGEIKLDDVELFETLSFFVVYKKAGIPLQTVAEQFLIQLDRHLPETPKKFRVHLDLFEIQILKSNCKAAKQYLNQLKQYAIPENEMSQRTEKYSKTCT